MRRLAASTARHRRIMQSSLRTLAAGRRVGRALASAPLAGAVIAPVVARRGPSALIALRACSSQSAASAHPQVIEVEPPADAAASDEKPEAHRPPRAARPTPPPWQLSAVPCHRPVPDRDGSKRVHRPPAPASTPAHRRSQETEEDRALRPREIVAYLDRYIVGQDDAKRAVAVALRNRWRRQRVDSPLREEIMPKNILMIGPTGVGKTEVARRLAKLANAPFIKVEATKFTEVGFVGKDVDQIMRDLVEAGMAMAKVKAVEKIKDKVAAKVEERVLDCLVGATNIQHNREAFRKLLRMGHLDDRLIEARGGAGRPPARAGVHPRERAPVSVGGGARAQAERAGRPCERERFSDERDHPEVRQDDARPPKDGEAGDVAQGGGADPDGARVGEAHLGGRHQAAGALERGAGGDRLHRRDRQDLLARYAHARAHTRRRSARPRIARDPRPSQATTAARPTPPRRACSATCCRC